MGPLGEARAGPEQSSASRPFPFQVEKSLQRIQNGQRNAMYTSQQSVENKVGGIPGWQALLTAVGFRLDPPASGLPAAVFFPTSDPGDRLQQCSSTIQSLLGEPQAGLEGRLTAWGEGWWLWPCTHKDADLLAGKEGVSWEMAESQTSAWGETNALDLLFLSVMARCSLPSRVLPWPCLFLGDMR